MLSLGTSDDASRCIGEAMTAIEGTKETWFEAETHRIAGEVTLASPERDAAKAQAYFERALHSCVEAAGKVLGTARGNEHGTALA